MDAIEIIEESIKTHEDWFCYFSSFPEQEKADEYTHIGDRLFHEKCISDYKKAIKQIEKIKSELALFKKEARKQWIRAEKYKEILEHMKRKKK